MQRLDIPFVIDWAAVDRVMLVYHVDGFSLDRKFDEQSTTTIVSRQQRIASPTRLVFAVLTILGLLFLHAAFAISVLQAVSADIL
jgi:hypothetical protein|tara:strand:- start:16815 stop:17069 length:255 start_codon:yes stop_codon:yes gene_type:complete